MGTAIVEAAGAPRRRIAITSVFGDPLEPRTWSGAPSKVAAGLGRHGFEVLGIHPRLGKAELAFCSGRYLLGGYGRIGAMEAVSRSPWARTARARIVAHSALSQKAEAVLHTGTLDLPAAGRDGAPRFLYCDHTWELSARYRIDMPAFTARARVSFEELERRSYAGMTHIFTFGAYVRENLIERYAVSPAKVTAVGSGMGAIGRLEAEKSHAQGHLLFVAKHYFREKGGELTVEAFRRARALRPDLRLVVVGQQVPGRRAADDGITWLGHVSWERLEQLYREAALLVQPMLNDPWGQVFLEALWTRTPVVGLRRNGLPEITDGGRYGFLVDEADPDALARTILEAMSDPARLAEMGARGQRHVAENYTWEIVTARIATGIAEALAPR